MDALVDFWLRGGSYFHSSTARGGTESRLPHDVYFGILASHKLVTVLLHIQQHR